MPALPWCLPDVAWRCWKKPQKLGDNVGKSLCVSADMTDPGSIAALFAKTMETYGRLDVLFNNAGMGAPPVNFGFFPSNSGRRW